MAERKKLAEEKSGKERHRVGDSEMKKGNASVQCDRLHISLSVKSWGPWVDISVFSN